ncbi:hypothetical protein FA13DRAFT_1715252 [Coprinellus micaceus]|uniref:Uncharacterized protein n=1 Tax=Coprinellus micaceus TaxID=71717 RepID=A0A4Y7SNU4_COPMI|nr:hypothetical protein FA13DRAFT_1715252 [Coprinellus micaceus]
MGAIPKAIQASGKARERICEWGPGVEGQGRLRDASLSCTPYSHSIKEPKLPPRGSDALSSLAVPTSSLFPPAVTLLSSPRPLTTIRTLVSTQPCGFRRSTNGRLTRDRIGRDSRAGLGGRYVLSTVILPPKASLCAPSHIAYRHTQANLNGMVLMGGQPACFLFLIKTIARLRLCPGYRRPRARLNTSDKLAGLVQRKIGLTGKSACSVRGGLQTRGRGGAEKMSTPSHCQIDSSTHDLHMPHAQLTADSHRLHDLPPKNDLTPPPHPFSHSSKLEPFQSSMSGLGVPKLNSSLPPGLLATRAYTHTRNMPTYPGLRSKPALGFNDKFQSPPGTGEFRLPFARISRNHGAFFPAHLAHQRTPSIRFTSLWPGQGEVVSYVCTPEWAVTLRAWVLTFFTAERRAGQQCNWDEGFSSVAGAFKISGWKLRWCSRWAHSAT